ncbi:hypothetical protein KKH27_03225 [bacterium]|nr:hypothetical protein [bacterium]MBU1983909.1 hypothetical protein [bacterium]
MIRDYRGHAKDNNIQATAIIIIAKMTLSDRHRVRAAASKLSHLSVPSAPS